MENGIGKRIAMLRKKKGFSQAELAEILNVSDKTVSKWENGGMPGIDLLPKLSKTFNVSIDYLMLGDGEEVEAEEFEDADCEMPNTEDEAYESAKVDFDSLSMDDIYVILSDQQELYTEEELSYLQARLDKLCAENNVTPIIAPKALKRKRRNPESESEIVTCPECGAQTSAMNPSCDFCGHEFFDPSELKEEKSQGLGCLAYAVAFLFPLIGLIWGLVKHDKAVVGFSIFMFIFNTVLAIILYNVLMDVLMKAYFRPYM